MNATTHAHHHHSVAHVPSLNQLSVSATVHCLTGCGIGEVLGMVISTMLGWGTVASIGISVALAFTIGYAFTLVPLLRGGMGWGMAASLALASDTVSMTVMEIADNAIMLLIPGAMDAGLTDVLFWGSLALSLGVAFVAAVPVNRWLIARGKGMRSFTNIIATEIVVWGGVPILRNLGRCGRSALMATAVFRLRSNLWGGALARPSAPTE